MTSQEARQNLNVLEVLGWSHLWGMDSGQIPEMAGERTAEIYCREKWIGIEL